MTKNGGGPPSPWCCNGTKRVAQVRSAFVTNPSCSKTKLVMVEAQGPLDETLSMIKRLRSIEKTKRLRRKARGMEASGPSNQAWAWSDNEQRFGGWPPNLQEEEGERFPEKIPLCHVAAADKPNRVVADPGEALLRHREELRRRGDPWSLDRIPDDRTTEISTENAPGQPGKTEAESREHIPLGHLSGAEWKRTFSRVHAEGVRPDLYSNLSHRFLGLRPGDDQTVENGLYPTLWWWPLICWPTRCLGRSTAKFSAVD